MYLNIIYNFFLLLNYLEFIADFYFVNINYIFIIFLQDKPPLFYERLHEALEYLVNFFYADEKGLTYDIIRCEIFLNIEERLEYHKMDTTLLIDRYYQQRLQVREKNYYNAEFLLII